MSPWLSIILNGSAKEGKMRFGESFGEACRFCGSTHIVVWPPSSAGNCAVCSDEVRAWEARLDHLAERKIAVARAAFLAAAAEGRALQRAQRWSARRDAVTGAAHALARRGAALGDAGVRRLCGGPLREARMLFAAALRAPRLLLRALPVRSRTAHNY
jgi:hypothetical protein